MPIPLSAAPCLNTPPPEPRRIWVLGPEEGCPPDFVGCLDGLGGVALEQEVRGLRRWVQEAWLRCGPPEAPAPTVPESTP